jgi:hypothetical protein
MIVRPEQFSKMKRAMSARYYDELRRFFREQSPQLVERLDDSTLLDWIEKADRAADEYGFEKDESRVAYIGLALTAGPAFHSDPQIRAYLQMPGGTPDGKIEWLYETVVNKFKVLLSANRDKAVGETRA